MYLQIPKFICIDEFCLLAILFCIERILRQCLFYSIKYIYIYIYIYFQQETPTMVRLFVLETTSLWFKISHIPIKIRKINVMINPHTAWINTFVANCKTFLFAVILPRISNFHYYKWWLMAITNCTCTLKFSFCSSINSTFVLQFWFLNTPPILLSNFGLCQYYWLQYPSTICVKF